MRCDRPGRPGGLRIQSMRRKVCDRLGRTPAVAVIEVRSLTKRFGSIVAVDGISFDVEPGKVTGFLGPNGAGKTTTLRMVLGLARPTQRHVADRGHALRAAWPIPGGTVGAALEHSGFHPGRRGSRPPAHDRARRRSMPESRADETLELVALARCRQAARGRVLARHEAAAGARDRAAGGPRDADPRRAGQRPRSAGHPLAARLPALVRGRGTNRARVEPRAVGGGPDRRRGDRDREGTRGGAGLDRRI